MVEKIGDWPDDWDVYDIGEKSDVKEFEDSGATWGGEAFRAVPPNLGAAVIVEKVPSSQPGEGPTWFVGAQNEASVIGGEGGDVGYKTQWPTHGSDRDRTWPRQRAEGIIDDLVGDFQDVDSTDDIGYL